MKKLLYLLPLCMAIQTYGQNIDSAMSACYPFDGDYLDASGNGNHATPKNGVTFVPDQWGNIASAVALDGIDDYIEILPSASLFFSDTLSVAFRFKTLDSGEQYLMSKHSYYNTVANYQFNFGFNLDADPTTGLFFDSDHNGNCTNMIQPSTTLTDTPVLVNNWYSVVMEFVHGVKSIYINGVLQKQEIISATGDPNYFDACNSGLLIFGSHWTQDPEFFNGTLDEVRIYKRALSIDEIIDYTYPPITSVNETQTVSEDVIVTPNPATTSIAITLKERNGHINIVDAMGRLVKTLSSSNGQARVDINELTPGIYGLHVATSSKSYTKLFIKQ